MDDERQKREIRKFSSEGQMDLFVVVVVVLMRSEQQVLFVGCSVPLTTAKTGKCHVQE